MSIKDLISDSYCTVHPYEGIDSVENELINNDYVVVSQNDQYIGILTPCDIIRRPHKIVIDCLTEKEHVSPDDNIKDVLVKFSKNKCIALPVFSNNDFIGIVEKHKLFDKLENKINDLYNKSVISEKIKFSFLCSLSHEIRTPLNGLLGFLEIIERIEPGDFVKDGKSSCEIVRVCADKFLSVMNDLIDFSMLTSGENINISREPVFPTEVFNDIKEFFDTSSAILRREVSIVSVSSDPSFNFSSDRKRIRQIIYHLIDNSVKYTTDGFVKFGFNHDDHSVLFYVKNSGRIINDEEKETMFNFFRRRTDFEPRHTDGIGFGLPLVKELAGLLGGKIDFVSDADETTFYVTLPL